MRFIQTLFKVIINGKENYGIQYKIIIILFPMGYCGVVLMIFCLIILSI